LREVPENGSVSRSFGETAELARDAFVSGSDGVARILGMLEVMVEALAPNGKQRKQATPMGAFDRPRRKTAGRRVCVGVLDPRQVGGRLGFAARPRPG